MIATYDPSGPGGPFALRGGEILIVGATACWAWYSLMAQRWLAGWSQLRITGMTIATGSVASVAIYLLAALAGLAPLRPAVPRAALDMALFSWMTIGPVILGFFLWHYAVRKLGFVVASLFLNLTSGGRHPDHRPGVRRLSDAAAAGGRCAGAGRRPAITAAPAAPPRPGAGLRRSDRNRHAQ